MGGNDAMTTVCVDVLGGDFAPDCVLEGCKMALAQDDFLGLVLTGPKDVVEPFAVGRSRVEPHPTTEFIDMGEHPAQAVRSKKDSSIVVGCRLVKEGRAQGFFSAGSTGAVMAAATLVTGRIKGVSRPAIATLLPSPQGDVIMLDSGANADCKPDHILQFAQMGVAYVQCLRGKEDPSVGLLNIGSEPAKGSQFAQECYSLLDEKLPEFKGNCEGDDIMKAAFDVVVCDGFTGNVALKTIEGTAKVVLKALKEILTSSLAHKAAAGVLKGSLNSLKAQMSSETIGGAPLLGVKGACVIGHGSSSPLAICNGIMQTARAARACLPQAIDRKIGGQLS